MKKLLIILTFSLLMCNLSAQMNSQSFKRTHNLNTTLVISGTVSAGLSTAGILTPMFLPVGITTVIFAIINDERAKSGQSKWIINQKRRDQDKGFKRKNCK